MAKQDQVILGFAAVILIGAVLLSDPKCNSGCRTLAQHLVNHGVDGLLGFFLA
jgi:hypothetical protein